MQSKLITALVVIAGVILLLVPGLVMAYAWGGTLNVEVAAVAIAVTLAVTIWLPRMKWASAFIAALVIAVPPYPFWTNWEESKGQYLHFFHGYSLQTTPIFTFIVVFVMAILLFTTIFWAIRTHQESRNI